MTDNNSNTTPETTAASNENDELVEVAWSGKKMLISKAKLDEWYHSKSFEDKVDYAESHPELIHPRHQNKKIAFHHFSKHASQAPNIDDYVLVHWSGEKMLLLQRSQLEDWYHSSYEMHVDFVKTHPECVIADNSNDKEVDD